MNDFLPILVVLSLIIIIPSLGWNLHYYHINKKLRTENKRLQVELSKTEVLYRDAWHKAMKYRSGLVQIQSLVEEENDKE